ncbi:hypothetical protein LOTGIDRAFT_196769 [Lottia gigantea]|uniref:Nitric oxide synthase-interacting protein n=1 Tax=Lottia gigantea TaxID=225164 RepID=V3Z1G9_LOTGI|nr:hypothetical protein LOTGIDRAFT_196769 [Lottia gigantea]ESO84363.1 hypothetical protein LOTGIDRAFT_196769 [Lottia gigantea]
MTRHARNSTAGTVYTYHERKKDTNASGYGSKEVRFGKDSVKEFDCCCLTLQPCKNPVVTPQGYLYDKEAILEYIIHKKREIARQMKAFEKQKEKAQKDDQSLIDAETAKNTQKFIDRETNPIVGVGNKSEESKPSTSSLCNMKNGKEKVLPSFWIPNLTPSAEPTKVKKPDEKVRCPMSEKPIKMKDLIPVKFTEIKDGDTKTALITKTARYVCAVTNDVLGNSVPCAVLRPSGCVVTVDCVEKLIRKDMLDPINGEKLQDKDIIYLQRGASGFSGSGVGLEAKLDGAAIQC